ncbi:MAG: hypothetical protein RMK80_10125, partial [Pseudobdellovibrionaceae bacterium]|nr:hypothetical protein [Pseudobdellovibrionaceae bacterium]
MGNSICDFYKTRYEEECPTGMEQKCVICQEYLSNGNWVNRCIPDQAGTPELTILKKCHESVLNLDRRLDSESKTICTWLMMAYCNDACSNFLNSPNFCERIGDDLFVEYGNIFTYKSCGALNDKCMAAMMASG